jgi:hypothetical protein
MEEMKRTPTSSAESEDPLPPEPLSEHADLIERTQEINSGSAPYKSMRQRLGSMAARRSADHLVEQAVIVEQGRFLRPGVDPRAA